MTPNLSQQIIDTLSRTPGQPIREIMDNIDYMADADVRRRTKLVAARISMLLKLGKLRHNNRPARQGRRYYITADAEIDRRVGKRSDEQMRNRHRAAPKKPPATPKPAPKPHQRGTELQVRRLATAVPPKTMPTMRAVETVEHYIARGGVVQILPRGHTANPLRYDHRRD